MASMLSTVYIVFLVIGMLLIIMLDIFVTFPKVSPLTMCIQTCKLKKSLYGLKQSARCWNEKLDAYLKSCDYKQSAADPCIYYRTQMVGKKSVIVLSEFM